MTETKKNNINIVLKIINFSIYFHYDCEVADIMLGNK